MHIAPRHLTLHIMNVLLLEAVVYLVSDMILLLFRQWLRLLIYFKPKYNATTLLKL